MNDVWSKEKAWKWYDDRTWMRGCNFMGSDCANRIDQWQALGFEKRLETADRELKLAAETGFNTIRIIPEFIVWDQDHDGFMERFDRYLATAWKYGISSMVVFGNDCMPPKNEFWKPLQLGEQHYDWGYHGGRKFSQHQHFGEMGYHIMDEPEIMARHEVWVREIMEKYKDDPRICVWDLYNEAGNSNRESVSLPNVKRFFEVAREVNPSQPITSCLWKHLGHKGQENYLTEVEQYIAENSDIITYHCYSDYNENIKLIRYLQQFERPIINTEWLARMLHNTVEEMFPLFYLMKIGCLNWGFVAGLYQTYEPWNGMWQSYEAGKGEHIDFKGWFHDLYRPNLKPYDPHEIELIQQYCKLADEDFAREQMKK